MGDSDISTKKFMANAEVFADVFNHLLYAGKQVIKPESLHELDTAHVVLPYGADGVSEPLQRQRDVLKGMTLVGMEDGKKAYLILGIENQTDIHFAMPVRNALLDAMQYSKQVADAAKSHRKAAKDGEESLTSEEFLSGFTELDKLIPVVTLVIHFGPEKWIAPLRLHEMMSIEDKRLLEYVPDYKINLIEPYAMSDEEIDLFHTDMREIMIFVKYAEDKVKLREKVDSDSRFKTLSPDAAALIKAVTHSTELNIEPNKEGKVNMCKALVDIKMEGHDEGRDEGRNEGIAEMVSLLMKKRKMTFDEAMEFFEIPMNARSEYERLLSPERR